MYIILLMCCGEYVEFQRLINYKKKWDGQVCVFGAGENGSGVVYDIVEKFMGINIDFYCDNYSRLKSVNGKEIHRLSYIVDRYTDVLFVISVKGDAGIKIKQQLSDVGYRTVVMLNMQHILYWYDLFISEKCSDEDKALFSKVLDDKEYISYLYKRHTGLTLDINNPQSFNQKLQWLKLNDHKSHYSVMADKYEMKKYVTNLIGAEYVVPCLGVWDNVDDINFSMLSNKCVLKCTHDSGSVIIIDKKDLDVCSVKNKLRNWLNRKFYYVGREWSYKNIKPRIIAEQYMQDCKHGTIGLTDYKFYCFNGVPKFLYISRGLEGNHKFAKMSFLNLKWEKTPFQREDFIEFDNDELPPKPVVFDEMIKISKILSKDIPFLRVDLFLIDNKIYVSELTFYPGAGYTLFSPYACEKCLGKLIVLK